MAATVLPNTDAGLWELACRDNRTAFEELVRRHQSGVCAVAYNACGDLSLSEDVSQETFWVAWRDRMTLIDPSRLRAWLCGIARNLARNSLRRSSHVTASLDDCPEPVATAQEPPEHIIAREEERLVWDALQQIPETYREPLILFYRENQSVAEVASTLELSVDAAKQRLSRGRNLLRDQVAELVEGTLRRSRPGGRFTVAVMAGLSSLAVGSEAVLAGSASAAVTTAGAAGGFAASIKGVPAAVATAGTAGILGGLLGIAGGLFGGWVGSWVPAQFSPTNR